MVVPSINTYQTMAIEWELKSVSEQKSSFRCLSTEMRIFSEIQLFLWHIIEVKPVPTQIFGTKKSSSGNFIINNNFMIWISEDALFSTNLNGFFPWLSSLEECVLSLFISFFLNTWNWSAPNSGLPKKQPDQIKLKCNGTEMLTLVEINRHYETYEIQSKIQWSIPNRPSRCWWMSCEHIIRKSS